MRGLRLAVGMDVHLPGLLEAEGQSHLLRKVSWTDRPLCLPPPSTTGRGDLSRVRIPGLELLILMGTATSQGQG